MRRGRALIAVSVTLAAVGLTACGGEDFENEPRPPITLEVSIQVSNDDLTVSPAEFGAGIANFTVVNLGAAPTSVEVDGPTAGETPEIAPGTSGVLKMEMEPGDYEAIALDIDEPFAFEVGPAGESASNDLLLP
ncbi:MAG: hypothetical protein FJW90_00900 [Actinobacteria bacterium]|nr:hypothetical protein [Actinomycetota bacterium]